MEFRLTYDGPLKAAAGVYEKHKLRLSFHNQLRILWKQILLRDRSDLLNNPPKKKHTSIIMNVNGLNFASLVCERLSLICELSIILLRPEAPGSVITQGGDIDNTLKKDVKYLVEQERVEKIGKKRGTIYLLPEENAQKVP